MAEKNKKKRSNLVDFTYNFISNKSHQSPIPNSNPHLYLKIRKSLFNINI